VVGECLRRGAAAAFAAIEGEKVRRVLHTTPQHGFDQIVDKLLATDCSLDADRAAGKIAQAHDKVEQLVHVGDIRMAVRADGIAAGRDTANTRDFLGDLVARQNAALAGLRAL